MSASKGEGPLSAWFGTGMKRSHLLLSLGPLAAVALAKVLLAVGVIAFLLTVVGCEPWF